MAVLKKLSEHCDVGAHLRDRLVCGLINVNIQRKLLTEEVLTFPRVVDTTMSMEAVARESQRLKSSLKVHAVSFSSPQGGDKCFQITADRIATLENSNATIPRKQATLLIYVKGVIRNTQSKDLRQK